MSASKLVRSGALEALKANLRAISKMPECYPRWNLPKVASAIEEYVGGKLCIAVKGPPIGGRAGNYQFLFHRVPPPKFDPGVEEHSTRDGKGVDGCAHFEADRVLIVRHVGDFPDQILSAGRAWRSRVWVLSENLLEDWDRHRCFLLGLPFPQSLFEANDRFGPRVVSVEPPEPLRMDCCLERPVERVLNVEKGVPEKVLDVGGWLSDQLELMDVLAGLRVSLDHKGKGIALQVGFEHASPLINARPCPVNIFLNRIEAFHA